MIPDTELDYLDSRELATLAHDPTQGHATHSHPADAGAGAGARGCRLRWPIRPVGRALHYRRTDHDSSARHPGVHDHPAPSRARQLQRALRRKYSRVPSVGEDADGITIKTSFILTYDNADASVGICETTKALITDDSFIEVLAVDNRWLARTTVFTGRCKATTLIR
jgi:hypothetical protein